MARGYPDDWNRRRKRVYKRDNWTCQTCGRKGWRKGNAELHAHHILPKSKGGGHQLSNLVTLCDRCHAEYHGDKRLLSDQQDTRSFFRKLFYGDPQESRKRKKKRRAGLKKLNKEASKRKKTATQNSGSPLLNHLLVFIFVGWWSLGMGNLIYELWRRSNSSSQNVLSDEDVQTETSDFHERHRRLGKKEGNYGFWQKRVDRGRNTMYNGCPNCNRYSLTVSWIKLDDGTKAKAVECKKCSSLYEETDSGLTEVDDPEALDSSHSALFKELFG